MCPAGNWGCVLSACFAVSAPHPDNDQMSESFLTILPPRPESILKSAAHGWNHNDPITHCAVSSLEAPSAVLSVKVLYPDVTIVFNEVPDPDPREPMAEVEMRAWTYDDTAAMPAFPVPNPEFALSTEIGAAFSLESWGEAAARLAAEFHKLTPCQMIGAMVFPGPFPSDQWPWDVVFKAQVMCALVLSRRESPSWLDSSPGKHIRDIVYGPVDWTTTAGLLALTDVARRDPSCADDIRSLFFSLLHVPMSPIWFMCSWQPIWQMLQHFPNLDRRTRAKVQQTVDDLEAEEDE